MWLTRMKTTLGKGKWLVEEPSGKPLPPPSPLPTIIHQVTTSFPLALLPLGADPAPFLSPFTWKPIISKHLLFLPLQLPLTCMALSPPPILSAGLFDLISAHAEALLSPDLHLCLMAPWPPVLKLVWNCCRTLISMWSIRVMCP